MKRTIDPTFIDLPSTPADRALRPNRGRRARRSTALLALFSLGLTFAGAAIAQQELTRLHRAPATEASDPDPETPAGGDRFQVLYEQARRDLAELRAAEADASTPLKSPSDVKVVTRSSPAPKATAAAKKAKPPSKTPSVATTPLAPPKEKTPAASPACAPDDPMAYDPLNPCLP